MASEGRKQVLEPNRFSSASRVLESRFVRFLLVGVLLLRASVAHSINVFLASAVLMLPMAFFSYTLNRLFVFALIA